MFLETPLKRTLTNASCPDFEDENITGESLGGQILRPAIVSFAGPINLQAKLCGHCVCSLEANPNLISFLNFRVEQGWAIKAQVLSSLSN